MKLNYQIIKEYFPNLKSERFDWDDCGFIVNLPCGIELTGHTLICNKPVKSKSLEGLDSYIYIETREELYLLMKMSLDEVFNWVKSKDTNFDIEKYKQDYEQICLG